METISYTLPPEQDGATVRHILKAALHVSSHAISRLTRTENGIRVNGIHARTVDILHTGDVLEVETSDHRPPRVRPTPGPWPLPIVWEDGHLLVVNKPAGMTAHASNFLPDTPTVAGALAWQRGADFVFHPVNRLDKGTTGLMVVAKSGYIHDRLRYALHTERFCREYRAVCIGCPDPKSGTIDAPIGRDPNSVVGRCVRPDGVRAVTHYEVVERPVPPAAAAGDRADPSAPGAHGLHRLPPGRGLAVRGRGPGPDPPAGPPRLRSGSGPSGDGRASVPDGAHPGGHGPAGAGAFDGNRVRK